MNKILEAYNASTAKIANEAKRSAIDGEWEVDGSKFSWDYDPNKNTAELYFRSDYGWNKFTLEGIAEGKYSEPVDQIIEYLYEEHSIEVSNKFKGKVSWWGNKGEVLIKFSGKPSFLDEE
jgi:hypothetical protein